jgi:hypothetical protein
MPAGEKRVLVHPASPPSHRIILLHYRRASRFLSHPMFVTPVPFFQTSSGAMRFESALAVVR